MKNKILYILLIVFIFTIPVFEFFNARILFVLFIFTFLFIRNIFFFQNLFIRAWDLILFFTVLLIGLTYSQDLSTGFREIETSLSLIGIPVIMYGVSHFFNFKLQNIFFPFLLGVLVAAGICFTMGLVSFSNTQDFKSFFFSNLTSPIDSHPTYFAYYLIFAITYGLYLLYYERVKFSNNLLIGSLIFFFIMLILTGGQTAFISMLLIFSFFIIKYLLEEKSSKQTIVFFLIVILTAFMFSTIVVFQNNDEFLQLSNQNDYWERMTLWESALKANDNPLLGVGTGDYKLVLNEYYRSHDLVKYANDNFNSHNQFIQVYFSNGLIGLFSLMILLARPLYLSVKTQNPLGILIFFPFIIYGVTEVFLGRYQGVVFFAFLHQAFISYHYYSSPQYSLKVDKF
jgi:O-antigen ligase